MRLLAGAAPLAGRRVPGHGLEIGYFAQHQLEQLDAGRSPLQHLAASSQGCASRTCATTSAASISAATW
jgi:ATPase subunit of ABC transporter with duplicated ATPase domains